MSSQSRQGLNSILVLILLLLVGCGQKNPQGGSTPSIGGEVGEQAPPITLTDLDGRPVPLAGMRNDIVVLSVWSETCAACLGAEGDLEKIDRLSSTYGDGYGVHVLAVNIIDPLWRIHEIRRDGGYSVRMLYDSDTVFAPSFEITELPTVLTFVIDPEGIIRYREKRFDAQTIRDLIADLPD